MCRPHICSMTGRPRPLRKLSASSPRPMQKLPLKIAFCVAPGPEHSANSPRALRELSATPPKTPQKPGRTHMRRRARGVPRGEPTPDFVGKNRAGCCTSRFKIRTLFNLGLPKERLSGITRAPKGRLIGTIRAQPSPVQDSPGDKGVRECD